MLTQEEKLAHRKEYQRQWQIKNPEKIKANRLRYLKTHAAERLAKRHSSEGRRERQLEWQTAREKRPWINLLNSSRWRAKKTNKTYDLTEEWAAKRWTGKCEVTGIQFAHLYGGGPKFNSPSLDRIDNSRGYEQENCRFVLQAVNGCKLDGKDEDMVMIARQIVNWADNKT